MLSYGLVNSFKAQHDNYVFLTNKVLHKWGHEFICINLWSQYTRYGTYPCVMQPPTNCECKTNKVQSYEFGNDLAPLIISCRSSRLNNLKKPTEYYSSNRSSWLRQASKKKKKDDADDFFARWHSFLGVPLWSGLHQWMHVIKRWLGALPPMRWDLSLAQ